MVYAPAWPGAAAFDAQLPFPVHRHPTSLMVPEPTVAAAGRPDSPARTWSTRCGSAPPPRWPCSGLGLRARPTSCGCSRAATATRSGGRCCPAPGRRCAASAAHRRRHHRLPLHPRTGRRRVRADGRAGTPPARHRRRPVPARSGRPRRGAPPVRPRRRARRHLRFPARGAQGPGHADPRAAGDPGAGARHAAAAGGWRTRRRTAARPGRGARGRGRGRVRGRGRRGRPGRLPRGGRRLRPAVPHPRLGAGRRGAGHRAPGGGGDGAAGGRGAFRRRAGDRAGGADRARRRRPRPARARRGRSSGCSPTRRAPPRWVPPGARGCGRSGAGDRAARLSALLERTEGAGATGARGRAAAWSPCRLPTRRVATEARRARMRLAVGVRRAVCGPRRCPRCRRRTCPRRPPA